LKINTGAGGNYFPAKKGNGEKKRAKHNQKGGGIMGTGGVRVIRVEVTEKKSIRPMKNS